MIEVWSHSVSTAIYWAVIHSLWQGLLVISVFYAIIKLNMVSNARFIYAIGLTSLITLFVAFVLSFSLAFNPMPMDSAIQSATAPLPIAALVSTEFSAPSMTLESLVSLAWLAGFLVFLLKLAFGNAALLSIRSTSVPMSESWQAQLQALKVQLEIAVDVELRYSTRVAVPAVFGFFKPFIIFPIAYFNQLTEEEIKSIIIHELIHIKRRDFALNLIQQFIRCFLFFNPGVWWLHRQINMYREFTCDDEVNKQLDSSLPYLEALYKVASFSSGHNESHAMTLLNNKSELTMRVKRIVNSTKQEGYFKGVFSLALIIGLALTMYAFKPAMTTTAPGNDLKTETFDMNTETSLTSDAQSSNQVNSIRKSKTEIIGSQQLHEKIGTVTAQNTPLTPATQSLDTVDTEGFIESLARRLEEKSEELEVWIESRAHEMESVVMEEVQKIEELTMKLEKSMAPKIEALEEMSEKEMAKLEELGEMLEVKMARKMENIEQQFNDGMLQDLERKLQDVAQKLEKKLSQSDEKDKDEVIKKYQLEMEQIQHKIHEEMKQIERAHYQIEKDEDIVSIQKEMEQLAEKIHESHLKEQSSWSEEAKSIQKEIEKLQEVVQHKVRDIEKDLSRQMQIKMKEVEKLARELEVAKQKNKN